MNTELTIHRDAPSWDGLRTAAVGYCTFSDPTTGANLLSDACDKLKSEGFGAVVGPMDGNTWARYRLPIWSDGSSAFAMEPDAGPHDFESYKLAGFDIAETHSSATAKVGSRGWANVAKGVSITAWQGNNPQQMLAAAYQLVSKGFSGTPFYTPIPESHFVAAYLPLLGKADPRFILQATADDGTDVGMTLAFPDPIRRGAIVLKTYVGTLPGVGRAMADRIHSLAEELGYTEVIHALMRDGIISQNQSRKFGGETFRKYALMGRKL